MSLVHTNFEGIQEFLLEQERILTKSIRNDDNLKYLLKNNNINLKDEILNQILNKLNRQMKKKYRIIWFTRQARFQITQQIIQIERENNKQRVENIDEVDNLFQTFENLDKDSKFQDIINDSKKFEILKELPDSNLIYLNDIEMIERYDMIKDDINGNITIIEELNNDNKMIEKLNLRIEKLLKEEETQISKETVTETEKNELEVKIKREMKKMCELLKLANKE